MEQSDSVPQTPNWRLDLNSVDLQLGGQAVASVRPANPDHTDTVLSLSLSRYSLFLKHTSSHITHTTEANTKQLYLKRQFELQYP